MRWSASQKMSHRSVTRKSSTSSYCPSEAKPINHEMINPLARGFSRLGLAGPSVRLPYHPGWPEVTPTVLLPDSERFPQGLRVRLRPVVSSDKRAWLNQRIRDEKFLRPVEPTAAGSWKDAHSEASWRSHFHYLGSSARSGLLVPMVIEVNGSFAGQLTLGNIQHGGI